MKTSFLKGTAYSVLDLITLKKGIARKINGMTVRFPPKWSRFFPGDYEADNFSFLKQYAKPGMHIIDIGAHIGLFSVCAARLTGSKGKVISFEPTPDTFSVFKDVLRLNNCDNVTALPYAIGAVTGKATFYISDVFKGCNANSLVLIKDKPRTKGYDVTVTTIDAVCSEYKIKPGLIKMDVEGAELDALRGSAQTMKSARPFFIVGLHPAFIANKGDSLKEIWDLIKENNYSVILNGSEMKEKDFITQNDLFDVQLIPV